MQKITKINDSTVLPVTQEYTVPVFNI